MTRERPIIFSGESVRAILDGRKTMTRRVIKPQPDEDGLARPLLTPSRWQDTREQEYPCPFGKPGDRLWAREQFSGPYRYHVEKVPPRAWRGNTPVHYWADGEPRSGDWTPPKSPLHMPRWASRITLEVTGVRVERLQDITPGDAWAEGVRPPGVPLHAGDGTLDTGDSEGATLESFAEAWDALNAKRGYGWESNPWVWVVEFKKVEEVAK